MTDTPKNLREMPRDEAMAIINHWLDTWEIEEEVGLGEWKLRNTTAIYADGEYRLPVTYPTVDWSHVADWVNYIAFDEYGESFASDCKPARYNDYWTHGQGSKVFSADTIASLTRGTCDWWDSLISRPAVEGKE